LESKTLHRTAQIIREVQETSKDDKSSSDLSGFMNNRRENILEMSGWTADWWKQKGLEG